MRVDIKCPSLNKSYAGRHWGERRAEADYIHSMVIASVRNQAVEPATEFPQDVTIIAHYKDNRRRDSGNVSSKEIIDGLVKAKIFPDDSTKYIRAVTTMAVNGKEEYVEVEW